MSNKIGYTDDQIEKLLSDIHSGKVNPYNLPHDLYMATARYLLTGTYEGSGGPVKSFEFGSPDAELVAEMRENIYIFSAAKTFQQVDQMGQLLLDDEDNIRPFSEWKKDAAGLFDEFNENYAEAEYNTAIGMAQNAVRWNQIESQKQVLPNLRYSAVMDANTSPECALLNGTTAPVEDPIWDTCMPPNHFNCRCVVEQHDEEMVPDADDDIDKVKEGAEELMNPVFKMNPGKDRVIFKDDHPYFDVAPKFRELAEQNFNLPIPEADE